MIFSKGEMVELEWIDPATGRRVVMETEFVGEASGMAHVVMGGADDGEHFVVPTDALRKLSVRFARKEA